LSARQHNINVLLRGSTLLAASVLVVWWSPCRGYRLFYSGSIFIYICCF